MANKIIPWVYGEPYAYFREAEAVAVLVGGAKADLITILQQLDVID